MPPRRSGLSWLAKRSSRLRRRSRQSGQTSKSRWSRWAPWSPKNSTRIAFASGSTQWQRPPQLAKLEPGRPQDHMQTMCSPCKYLVIWSSGIE
uniref:Uncharacterized protein n=1 Tax=Oryza brachyantha TaxID=4533 RepID=J3M5N6_ORYBR